MQKLKQLLQTLRRYRIGNKNILGSEQNSTSKLGQLLEMLNVPDVMDNEASIALYGRERDRSFSKLKYDLRQRLLQQFFFVDFDKNAYHAYEKNYHACYRQWLLAKTLLRIGLRQIGLEELKKALDKAKKCGITFIELESNRFYRIHYGMSMGNAKEYQRKTKDFNVLLRKYQAELTAEGFFIEIASNYATDISTKPHVVARCKSMLESLDEYKDIEGSLDYTFYRGAIQLWSVMSVNSYQKVINTAKNCLEQLIAFPLVPNMYLRYFYGIMTMGYIQLRDYEEGSVAIEAFLGAVKKGARDWFKIKEFALLLALHAQKYDEAWSTLNTIFQHKKFASIFPMNQENWRIYRAYLWFLISREKISLSLTEQKKLRQLKIYRFLNELPLATKDKSGMNVSVLIIQTLYLLHHKKYDDLYDKIAALKKYSNRYLRKEETVRSLHFFKMLITVLKNDFNRTKTLQKVQSHLAVLDEHPLYVSNQTFGIEIIPYEHLWELVIEMLDDKLH